MVLGPFTPPGIRGEDYRDLTQLYDQLTLVNSNIAALAAAMTTTNTHLVDIRDAVLKLSGSPLSIPATWTGLPEWLDNMFGAAPAGAADKLGQAALVTRSFRTQFINYMLGSGFTDDEEGLFFQTLGVLGTQLPRLTNIRDNTALMSAVLGLITDIENGATIKSLLNDIADATERSAICCEEQDGGGESQPQNAPPDPTLCEDNVSGSQIQVQTLIPITTGQKGFASGSTRIGLDFGSPTGGILVYDGVASAEANIPVYLVSYTGTLNGCVEWDLTGNSAPPWVLEAVLVEEVGGEWEATLATSIGTVFGNGPDVGGWSRANGLRFAFRLVYDSGEDFQAPGKNFWLSYGNAPT